MHIYATLWESVWKKNSRRSFQRVASCGEKPSSEQFGTTAGPFGTCVDLCGNMADHSGKSRRKCGEELGNWDGHRVIHHLVGGFKHFWFSISYMGCHPFQWLSLHHFSGWLLHHQPEHFLNHLKHSAGCESFDPTLRAATCVGSWHHLSGEKPGKPYGACLTHVHMFVGIICNTYHIINMYNYIYIIY